MSARTAALVERVARWRRAGHPAAAPARGPLADGADLPEALAACGAHPGLIALARAARPADADAFLEALASALGRAEDRRRSLQGAARYPALLAAAGVAVAVVLALAVRPAAADLSEALTGTAHAPFAPSAIALVVSSAILAWLAVSLGLPVPAFPFRGAKGRQERALLLCAAATGTSHGAALPDAIEAASALSASTAMRAEAAALASSLRAGAVPAAAPLLLGPVGSALLASTTSQGEGPATLAALAEVAETIAGADLPLQLLRTEVVSVLLGSIAIAAGGIGLFHTYSAALAAF